MVWKALMLASLGILVEFVSSVRFVVEPELNSNVDALNVEEHGQDVQNALVSARAIASGKTLDTSTEKTGILSLTILSLVGVYMSMASKTIEANAAFDLSVAEKFAGETLKRMVKLQREFSEFYNALKDDLNKIPEQWKLMNGNHKQSQDIEQTLLGAMGDHAHVTAVKDLDWADTARSAAGLLVGKKFGMRMLGSANKVTGAALSAVNFLISLSQLSNAIKVHAMTREDADNLAQTAQFHTNVLAQESIVFEGFCRFVKSMWEQALAASTLEADQFENEKNAHIAGEMQRAWRCHCISLDENEYKIKQMAQWKAQDSLDGLEPNGVHRNHVAGVMSGENRKRVLVQLHYKCDNVGCLNGRLTLSAKGRRADETFTSDLQVVLRKCKDGKSAANGTDYEQRLKRQGYKLLLPEPDDGSLESRRKFDETWAGYNSARHPDCLAAAGTEKEQMADLQQGYDDKDYGVVLIYVKESDSERDIPVSDIKVIYGTDAVLEFNRLRSADDIWQISGSWDSPLPVYQDQSVFSKRLNIAKEVPFVVFKRDHATVSCPTAPNSLASIASCCELSAPSRNTVTAVGGKRWCKYMPFISKNSDRVAGYEAHIAMHFPNLGVARHIYMDPCWCGRNVPHGEPNENCQSPVDDDVSPRGMWLKGCDLAISRVMTQCERFGDTLVARYGRMGSGYFGAKEKCTGRAFLLEGDPMWSDPNNHTAGRKFGLLTNWVLADVAHVYGEAGIEPTCKSGM